MSMKTSRRSLVVGAAALPILAAPAVAATEPDEIYTMIEAHRRAHDLYTAALHAADVTGGDEIEARIVVGHFKDGDYSEGEDHADGSRTIVWRPTGELKPIYASSLDDIERAAPKGAERDAWIAEKLAELKAEEQRIAESDPGRAAEIARIAQLQKTAATASDKERRLLWDLVSTPPDTFKGVTAVLAHLRAREAGTLATLMDVEYIEELLLSVEYTICAHAGLPEPQVPEPAEHDIEGQDDDA
jgi:hypothetical protein